MSEDLMKIDVNGILSEIITGFDSELNPLHGGGFSDGVARNKSTHRLLAYIINNLGKESAKFQGLSKPVTSADQLASHKNYLLFLMKDTESNNGKGQVIGYLKVAKKDLFLYPENRGPIQASPCCILDFFICGDFQRKGNGKFLFDFVLNYLNSTPKKIAIDCPTTAFAKFLEKNYKIEQLILQPNNLSIPEGFFEDMNQSCSNTLQVPSVARGRFAAQKRHSVMRNVIHGSFDANWNPHKKE